MGTWSETELEPQADSASPESRAVQTARAMRERTNVTAQLDPGGVPSGPIRRPHVGESLRSFWES